VVNHDQENSIQKIMGYYVCTMILLLPSGLVFEYLSYKNTVKNNVSPLAGIAALLTVHRWRLIAAPCAGHP